MNAIIRPQVVMYCLFFCILSCKPEKEESSANEGKNISVDVISRDKPTQESISFTEDGINLYGKFIYESEGESFSVWDTDGKELIAAPAVMTCIRDAYSVGYYDGGSWIDGKEEMIPRIFFVLTAVGEVSFYRPSDDGKFFGKPIKGTLRFDK